MSDRRMSRSWPRRTLIAGLLACGLAVALPGTSSAATTIGPDVSVVTSMSINCANDPNTGTCSNSALGGGALVTSPIDGVVVRWRARAITGMSAALQIVRPTSPGYSTGAGSSDFSPQFSNVGEFPTRLPIRANDRIGIRTPPASILCYSNCVATINGGNLDFWRPALVDGEMPGHAPTGSPSGSSVLVNADVEPDADADGFGDETQDKCPGTAGGEQGCQPAPPAATKPKGPSASLSGSRKQDILSQGAVLVTVTSAEAGSAAATGAINVPGTSKSFALKPASAAVVAHKKVTLKLKLSRKVKKAVKKALSKRRKLKANVNVTVNNAAGGATVVERTVKVKRKRKRR